MGRPPIAIAAADDWDDWVVEPRLPAGIVNLGTSREINLEILSQLKPDVIFSTPYLERLRPKLERVAPVESFPVHATGSSPWPNLVAAARAMGKRLGAEQEAEGLVARTEAELAALSERVAPLRDRPVLLAAFQDARNAWVYGANSLYEDALQRLGLTNGWTRPTNPWGFSQVGVEALAQARGARLFCLAPTPPDALALLSGSPIWRATGFADEGRLFRLPPVLAFGGLPSVTRLARLLAEAAQRA
ncbi:ABC transporter substrate-binding protein [Chenggangzhangella methanolivorans]|uniref:ABC transporter substrate-binding protein n=2 Tax=Chenggangzhangella methanolivorans TaxID=1437009 RepID=A0A9E6UJV5_9HYPH|nr:ABC transporter substrate-binding protein [Chenggangzhangella methanolivorans]